MNQGNVILVGAGPSDIGLLTLRGKEAIEAADVVVYDALVGQAILSLIPRGAKRIYVGKRSGHHTVPQEQISEILLSEAQAGSRVVRLKGGDPFLFGRGGEELELLAENGIPFEIVPGVTSAVAVPAYAGIPVTHRDFCSSVHIITGHAQKGSKPKIDYQALTRLDGTLVFLMGVSAAQSICDGLIAAGMPPDMPAALLERGTTARQRRVISTVASIVDDARTAGIVPPAILLVGRVCALSEKFAWAEKRPLGGRTVLVTRPAGLASRLTGMLRRAGAEVAELPAIETRLISPNPKLERALGSLSDISWLVFTSPSGVRHFFEYLSERKSDIRSLAGLKIAAIGAATKAELSRRGLLTELMPETYSAEALGEALAEAADGERLLIVRAKAGTPELTEKLDAAGIAYNDIPLYETENPERDSSAVAALLDAGEIDYVAFTSASTVRGFVNALGKRDYSGICAACIGRATETEAKKYGMRTIVAEHATMESMLKMMIDQKGAN